MFMHRSLFIIGACALSLLSADAQAGQRFGSRLNREPTPAETCRAAKPQNLCSWVMTIAQNAPGRHRAPKNGTIATIRLLSCSPGSFVLQVARADPASNKAKVVRSGPLINYKGSASNCNGDDSLFIEIFTVRVPILAGEYLSVAATRVGFIYNASGDGTHVFDPLLPDGGPLRIPSNVNGSGMLLLQAEYAP